MSHPAPASGAHARRGRTGRDSHAALAGVTLAVVGSTSSFVVVLAGLQAVGATPAQATSGLVAVTLAQAIAMPLLAWRHRMPVILAWSTPGAALLVSTGTVTGGWPAAVGAFGVAGVLIVLTGLLPWLGRAVAAIPVELARAMLAGVLLPLCLAPVTGVVEAPVQVGLVVLAWLVGQRWWPRWSVPVALAVALGVLLVGREGALGGDLLPRLSLTTPTLTLPALVGIAVPLWVVTMASQNVPGVAVLASYGYAVPWRESMTVTGLATVAASPFGGHAVNLAAITAALGAGPAAGPDPTRRWRSALWAAGTYAALAAVLPALAAVVVAAPGPVVQAAAGLALLGTLGSSLAGAFAAERGRESVAVCFVVAASGISVAGVGAAFWALVAGLAVRWALAAHHAPVPPPPTLEP